MSFHPLPSNSPLQIPWPASDSKKNDCALKRKSNEVSRDGWTGAHVPGPSLADLRQGRQQGLMFGWLQPAYCPMETYRDHLSTSQTFSPLGREGGQILGAQEFGASGLGA